MDIDEDDWLDQLDEDDLKRIEQCTSQDTPTTAQTPVEQVVSRRINFEDTNQQIISQLKAENKSLQAKIDQALLSKFTKEGEIKIVRENLARLQIKNDELSLQLSTHTDSINKVRKQLEAEMEEKLERLKTELLFKEHELRQLSFGRKRMASDSLEYLNSSQQSTIVKETRENDSIQLNVDHCLLEKLDNTNKYYKQITRNIINGSNLNDLLLLLIKEFCQNDNSKDELIVLYEILRNPKTCASFESVDFELVKHFAGKIIQQFKNEKNLFLLDFLYELTGFCILENEIINL
ncbi:hypothetical protein O9G_003539 [Rozella allomycis CSF55]|uniref:Uncharacterized protein n=1 Tax=Rozella allomycis (strain CSF55) TaxID=988480 RepID=A0A075B459_ROZAC|nr:hypothetical protein O9G_003539 [Rozella allomycis CSF55]|eukprot:EPZ35894.1 hypothetical protein O9G_003539 [Rozella allomycis CSF55]